MGRMQLFTENTITTVLPFLAEPSHRVAARVARLWTIVFGANVIGAFLAAAFYLIPDVLSADLLGAMIHVSEHAVSLDPMTAFLRGIPAGVLIAALVWMLPRGGSSKLALIVLFTWLIAASDLTHVVAGSVEVALLIIGGNLSVPAGFGGFILPVLLGNILGGTAIFTALAWGQVHQEAILHLHLPDTPARFVFENFGYCLGFVVVIMGRMQLFTENTITTVLPFLAEPSHRVAARVARLWTIVFGANVIGAFLAAAFYLIPDVLSADLLGAMIHVSEHAVSLDPMTAFLRGIPAGVLIAALVWMLPRGGSSKLALIVLFTWLIAASDLTHVVAGSVEVALLIIGGNLSVPAGFGGFILPVLLGNILGGTAIFTALAWGQVHQE
ncbi:Inner membrane protein YfdC, partial [Durusdinium trenchii]